MACDSKGFALTCVELVNALIGFLEGFDDVLAAPGLS